MKNINVKATLIILSILIGCSPSQNTNTEEKEEKEVVSGSWNEMEEFHNVMAESFHPYMDSSNLEPAKANAIHLSQLAESWQAAPLPAKVDNEEIKKKLEQLKEEAVMFTTLINSGDEKQIGESLTRIHTTFHEIQDAWYAE